MTPADRNTAAYWREQDRPRVEEVANQPASHSGQSLDPRQIGLAKADLIRRDREYTEQQERSRRSFETALADKQLSAATDVAKATRRAMWAAFAAAFGAIIQAVVAVASFASFCR